MGNDLLPGSSDFGMPTDHRKAGLGCKLDGDVRPAVARALHPARM